MSVGARHETTLAQIQAEFHRLTDLGLFHFPAWYAEQVRALRASTGRRYPVMKQVQERLLLQVLRATPKKTP